MKVIKYYIEFFRHVVLIYEQLGQEHNYYPFGGGNTRSNINTKNQKK